MENLLRAKKTTIEMALDRGYEVNDQIYLDMSYRSFLEFASKYDSVKVREEISALYPHSTEKGKFLNVKFITKATHATKNISQNLLDETHTSIDEMFEGNSLIKKLDVVLVGDSENSSATKKFIKGTRSMEEDKYFQYFSESDLIFNPTKSKLNSKVELVPEKEAAELLKKMGIQIGETNLILEYDPICRYYGFKPNSLIRFTRNNYQINPFCPTQITYRSVMEDISDFR